MLTAIKKNTTIIRLVDGTIETTVKNTKGKRLLETGGRASTGDLRAEPLAGHMLRYVYFLKPEERANLAVPVLPFSAIAEAGASMYLGRAMEKARVDVQSTEGGSIPTPSLQST